MDKTQSNSHHLIKNDKYSGLFPSIDTLVWCQYQENEQQTANKISQKSKRHRVKDFYPEFIGASHIKLPHDQIEVILKYFLIIL